MTSEFILSEKKRKQEEKEQEELVSLKVRVSTRHLLQDLKKKHKRHSIDEVILYLVELKK